MSSIKHPAVYFPVRVKKTGGGDYGPEHPPRVSLPFAKGNHVSFDGFISLRTQDDKYLPSPALFFRIHFALHILPFIWLDHILRQFFATRCCLSIVCLSHATMRTFVTIQNDLTSPDNWRSVISHLRDMCGSLLSFRFLHPL